MAMKNLEKAGKIKMTTIRRGRKSVTIFTLLIPVGGIERSVHSRIHIPIGPRGRGDRGEGARKNRGGIWAVRGGTETFWRGGD